MSRGEGDKKRLKEKANELVGRDTFLWFTRYADFVLGGQRADRGGRY